LQGLWRKLNGLSSPVCLGFAFITGHLACITSRLGLWLVAFRARLGLNDSMLKVAKGLLLARWLQARWLHRILADAKGKGFSFAATSKDILCLDCLFFAFGWAGFHFPFGWAAKLVAHIGWANVCKFQATVLFVVSTSTFSSAFGPYRVRFMDDWLKRDRFVFLGWSGL